MSRRKKKISTRRWLDFLIQPFERGQTARWRERQKIGTLLEAIKDAANEADLCLEKDDLGERKIQQAKLALENLEELWLELRELNAQADTVNPNDL